MPLSFCINGSTEIESLKVSMSMAKAQLSGVSSVLLYCLQHVIKSEQLVMSDDWMDEFDHESVVDLLKFHLMSDPKIVESCYWSDAQPVEIMKQATRLSPGQIYAICKICRLCHLGITKYAQRIDDDFELISSNFSEQKPQFGKKYSWLDEVESGLAYERLDAIYPAIDY